MNNSQEPPIRTVAAGRGLEWLTGGWGLFRQAPLIWIVNILIVGIIFVVLGAIPLIGIATNILSPVFAAGLVLGCRDLERGQELTVPHVFAGFSHRTSALIGAGLLGLGLSFAVVVLMGVIGAVMGLGASWSDTGEQIGPAFIILALFAMLLFVPIAMAIWFAPALLAFRENLGVVDAFKASFSGCMANIMPFLIYGLVVMVAGFIATIPLGLGWFILGPVLVAANYLAYKDIYADGQTP